MKKKVYSNSFFVRFAAASILFFLPNLISAQVEEVPVSVQKIIAARATNNYANTSHYSLQHLNSLIVYARDIDGLKEKKLTNPFKKLIEEFTTRTSKDSGDKYVPLLLIKSKSSWHQSRNPRQKKDIIEAYYTEDYGVFNKNFVGQASGYTFIDFNFYEDFVEILDRKFISPLAKKAPNHYSYTVTGETDSTISIAFTPNHLHEMAFTGYFVAEKSSQAIKYIYAAVQEGANFNFLRNLVIQQEFKRDSNIFVPRTMRITFEITDYVGVADVVGEICSEASSYKTGAAAKPATYRFPLQLMPGAKQNYLPQLHYDSLACATPFHRKLKDTGSTTVPDKSTALYLLRSAITGYFIAGPIEIGPYPTFYQQNAVEGNRFQLGFRTRARFQSRFRGKAYLAYGTQDREWKYQAQGEYFLSDKYWTQLGVSYRNDLEGLSNYDYMFSADNFSDNSFALRFENKMFRERQWSTWLHTEVIRHNRTRVQLTHRNYTPAEGLDFAYKGGDGEIKYTLDFTEIAVENTFSKDDLFIRDGSFRHRYRVGPAPSITLRYAQGIKAFGGEVGYHRLSARINQKPQPGLLGRFEYTLDVSKTFGAVPYPVLDIPRGNQNWYFRRNSFNAMRNYEFVCDECVNLFVDHHFDGWLLKNVPVINRTDLRTIVSLNGGFGRFSAENKQLIPSGTVYRPPGEYDKGPYVEAGYGLENILKVLRVQLYHRLTYRDPNLQQVFLRVGVYLTF